MSRGVCSSLCRKESLALSKKLGDPFDAKTERGCRPRDSGSQLDLCVYLKLILGYINSGKSEDGTEGS